MCISSKMLTFETLFELLRKEKMNPELQSLEETFFQQTVEYLKEKGAILKTEQQGDSIFAADTKKTQLQLESARKIIRELYEKRENKMMNLALLSSRAGVKEAGANMLPEEKRLYEETLDMLNTYRGGVVENILQEKTVSIQRNTVPKDIKTAQKEPTHGKMVRFVHAVPKFVADDLNVYGPFEQEDMSFLPTKTANLLVQRKRVEEVQVENTQNEKNIL